MRPWLVGFAASFGATIALAAACGNNTSPSPYGTGGGSTSGPGAGGGGGSTPADAGQDADPTLGGPCTDDGQCDDHLDCTFDKCDHAIGRCRFTPDDSKCQDTSYCNGAERCDNQQGCVAGDPVGCGDMDPCTIDTCDEGTHACLHAKRDADGDGDPDAHCGGGDCDDSDPTVSSKLPEVCANKKDDNCNGKVDETPCSAPQHDTCLDPLDITTTGSYAMTTAGAKFDYATTCPPGNGMQLADVVAAIHVPAGPPVDVAVRATTTSPPVAVAIDGQCGVPASELACGTSFVKMNGGSIAKLRARSIGDPKQETVLPLYVTTQGPSPVTVDVAYVPATTKPTNETCGTAAPITIGVPVTASIVDATQDLAGACSTKLGELVYTFDLAAPANVDIYGSSVDGDGSPSISLRDAACSMTTDEIACQTAPSVHLVRHAIAAGTYYVAVSASAPTDVKVTVETSAPTPLAPDETCMGSPTIALDKTILIDLSTHQDDIDTGCLPGAVDAAYELDLAKASDVLLVERISNGDEGAIELAAPACDMASLLACGVGTISPIRSAKHNVPAGSYRVVAESLGSLPVDVTAFVRDAVPPTLVPFADACADVQKIPSTGGFFQGNTANATANFEAGCDQSGLPKNGAPDQLLELDLPAKKRVVLDMMGSGYQTLLDVRQGPPCPGQEVMNGCAAGYLPSRSFLDLTLDAGTYYLQIDGFALDKGQWFLDVRVVDP